MILQGLMPLSDLIIKEEYKQHSIVFYDAECSFCNATIGFIIKKDKNKEFYFSNIREKYTDPKYIELFYKGQFYFKSEAISIILSELEGIYSIIGFVIKIVPAFISNCIYDLIAKYRKRISVGSSTCEIYTKEIQTRFISIADLYYKD